MIFPYDASLRFISFVNVPLKNDIPPRETEIEQNAMQRWIIMMGTLAVCILIVCSQCAAQQDYTRQNTNGQKKEPRYSGSFGIGIGGGSINGLRLSINYGLSTALSSEASYGIARLDDGREARSATLGVNYFTHPQNDISGFLSILTSYYYAAHNLPHLDQHRYIVAGTFGVDYQEVGGFHFFFRTGPAIHFLSASESGATQVYLHFDVGVGWTF